MVTTPVSMPLATTGPVSAATIAKVTQRLLPFLLLMYVLAFLDRANVGFAKKAFQLDTNISDAAFAFGASIFFLGYAVLEVPSNLIMHKVGARAWMCRIMVSWGLLSAAMMFAYSEVTFYIFRFLLGVAEAGFFPGVILYLTYWYPSFARAKATGLFYFGAPLAFIVGSPLSGLLLEMNGVGGLTGWQWMFLVEGLLASIVGVWAYWYLDNKPSDAKWLTDAEKTELSTAISAEEHHKSDHSPGSVLTALGSPKVLYLSLIYLIIQMSVYGLVFYLPTQVANLLGQERWVHGWLGHGHPVGVCGRRRVLHPALFRCHGRAPGHRGPDARCGRGRSRRLSGDRIAGHLAGRPVLRGSRASLPCSRSSGRSRRAIWRGRQPRAELRS